MDISQAQVRSSRWSGARTNLLASVVGVHVAALADNVRVDVLCVALALASVAVRIIDGHFAVTGKVISLERGSNESTGNNDLRGASTISPGY